MNSVGVFAKDLPIAIASEGDIIEGLSCLLEMIDYSKQYNTSYFVHEDSLYYQNMFDVDFSTWIFERSDGQLQDIKRELQIKINQSETIHPDIELASVLSQSDTYSVGKPFPYFVWSVNNFLEFKQNRLKSITSKSEFIQELPECYRNIYFDDSVPASINTLNNNFIDIKDDIVFHLNKLDNYYEGFCTKFKNGCSFRELSLSFAAYAGIECSPQAGRDTIYKLKRKYQNSDTGSYEEIVCELHTKFTNYNRSATKRDRIYFHPGKPNICEGKIIIIHIGKHL